MSRRKKSRKGRGSKEDFHQPKLSFASNTTEDKERESKTPVTRRKRPPERKVDPTQPSAKRRRKAPKVNTETQGFLQRTLSGLITRASSIFSSQENANYTKEQKSSQENSSSFSFASSRGVTPSTPAIRRREVKSESPSSSSDAASDTETKSDRTKHILVNFNISRKPNSK